MSFVKKIKNVKEYSSRYSLTDYSELGNYNRLELQTKAGLILLLPIAPRPLMLPNEGEVSPTVENGGLFLRVAVPCCRKPGLDVVNFKCRNCSKHITWKPDVNVIMNSRWLDNEDFITTVSTQFEAEDSFTSIMWAGDLYRFLRNHFVAK